LGKPKESLQQAPRRGIFDMDGGGGGGGGGESEAASDTTL